MSTCTETVNEPYAYFKDKPLTVILYSEHPNHYSSLISSLPTFQGQVVYRFTHDINKLVSPDPKTISPIFILCHDQLSLRDCIKTYKLVRAAEPCVVLITTREVAKASEELLRGVLVCAQHEDDVAVTVKALADALLRTCLCEGMVAVDYVDIFPLFGSSNGGRLLLTTASDNSDTHACIDACIDACLADLKNRLPPNTKSKYVIGYLSFNYAVHSVSRDDFDSLIEGLDRLVGDIPIVVATPNVGGEDIVCRLVMMI